MCRWTLYFFWSRCSSNFLQFLRGKSVSVFIFEFRKETPALDKCSTRPKLVRSNFGIISKYFFSVFVISEFNPQMNSLYLFSSAEFSICDFRLFLFNVHPIQPVLVCSRLFVLPVRILWSIRVFCIYILGDRRPFGGCGILSVG